MSDVAQKAGKNSILRPRRGAMERLLQGWPLALQPQPGGGAACCVTRDVAAGELLLRAAAYAVAVEDAHAERVCAACGRVSPPSSRPLARACRECAGARFCSAACAAGEGAQRHAAGCGGAAARAALAVGMLSHARPLSPDERAAVRLAVAARLQHAAAQRFLAPERTLSRGAPTYTDVLSLPPPPPPPPPLASLLPPPKARAAGKAAGSAPRSDGSGSAGSGWSGSSADGGGGGSGDGRGDVQNRERTALGPCRGAGADGGSAAAGEAAAARASALAALAHAALLRALPEEAVPSADELGRLLALAAAHGLTVRAGGGAAVARVLAPGAALLARCGRDGGASAALSFGPGFCVEARALRHLRAGEEVCVAAGGAAAHTPRQARQGGQEAQQPASSCTPTPLARSRAASPASGAPTPPSQQQQQPKQQQPKQQESFLALPPPPPPPPRRGPLAWLRAGACFAPPAADASPSAPALTPQQVVPLALSLTPFAAAVYLPPAFCLRAARGECVADGGGGAAEALYAAPFAARCYEGVLRVELLGAHELPCDDDDVAVRLLCALSCGDCEAACALGGGESGVGACQAQLPVRRVACAALRLRLRAAAPRRWRARGSARAGEPLGGAELPLVPLLASAQQQQRRHELVLHLRGPGGGGMLHIALRFDPYPPPPSPPLLAAADSDCADSDDDDDDDAAVADIGVFEPLCFFDHAPTHTQAALWRRRRTLVLAFRGTEGAVAADWATDFQYRLVARRTGAADGGGEAAAAARAAAARAACRVHEGAQKGYLAVRRRVLAALDDARGVAHAAASSSRAPSALGSHHPAAAARADSPPLLSPPARRARPWRVLLTGHSLGGALATLCAADLAELFPPSPPSSLSSAAEDVVRVRCVTYGSPRAGDAHFAARFAQLQPRALRLVNGRDVVPSVPPRLLGYAHACDGLHLRADGALRPLPPAAEPGGARVLGALCSGVGVLDHGFGLYAYVDGLRRVADAAGVVFAAGGLPPRKEGDTKTVSGAPAGGHGNKAAPADAAEAADDGGGGVEGGACGAARVGDR
jgi:hypothetical protein